MIADPNGTSAVVPTRIDHPCWVHRADHGTDRSTDRSTDHSTDHSTDYGTGPGPDLVTNE